MAKRTRRSRRKGVLDWFQGVLDETKDFVDDSIDRCRDDDRDDEIAGDIDELKQAIADLNAKLDRLGSSPPPSKTTP